MSPNEDDKTDIYMMLATLALLLFAMLSMPRVHSHDGGRTWHAHGGQ